MKLIKESTEKINDFFRFKGKEYEINGEITLELWDDSDYTSYGPYQEVKSHHSLKINPFNADALEAFIFKAEAEF